MDYLQDLTQKYEHNTKRIGCFLRANFYIRLIQFLKWLILLNFLISPEHYLEPYTIRNDLGHLWPNLKNLSGGLNLSRGLNMVGST